MIKIAARSGWSVVILAGLVGCSAENTGASNSSPADVFSRTENANETASGTPQSQALSDDQHAASAETDELAEGSRSRAETGELRTDVTLVATGDESGATGNSSDNDSDGDTGTEADAVEEQDADEPDESVAGEMPLVYDEEHTGADCSASPLPGFDQLPAISGLPDPFLMSSGERMTSRADWRCRRAEIKSILEEYDVGEKPGKPTTVNAVLNGNTIRISINEGGASLEMTATLSRPVNAVDGPIPAIIGINSPTGSLPASIFSSRGIATINYDAN